MSIASELQNYADGLDDAYDAVNDMSGIVPQHKNMDNLDQAIRTIPQSSGPAPGDGTLTIQKNGSTVATFTANQSTNTTANITVNDGKAVYMDQDSNYPDHILLYNDFAMTEQITDIYNDVYLKILNGEHIVFIDRANGQGTPLGYPYTYMYYGSSSFPDDEAYITLYGVKYDRDTHQFHPNEFSTAILIVYTYQSPDYAVIAPGTEYQGKLTAGSNITISNGTISATDTTYSDFTGATSSTAGTSGLAPAPAVGDEGKFLKGDGLWSLLASADLNSLTTSYSSGDFARVDIGHFHILWKNAVWSNMTAWVDVGYVADDIKDGTLLMARWNPGYGYSPDGESRASQLNSSNGLIKAQIVSPNGGNSGTFLAIIYK